MKKRNLLALFFLLVALFFLLFYPNKKSVPYMRNEGKIFGTFYSISYQHPDSEDLGDEVLAELKRLDASLSIFNDSSTIAKINDNVEVDLDSLFLLMYRQAFSVSQATQGAFDITVAPLVDLWGFGRGTPKSVSSLEVDSARLLVGYNNLKIINNRLVKPEPRMRLDASAIAKGLGVDVALQCLKEHGCTNAMVEIGGELACIGLNPAGQPWKIGVNKPVDDSTCTDRSMECVLHLSDVAVATSGNYRQFYYRDGKKYAHTIDPRTGYPVNHNLLSATVIAPSCMMADAWATAFMVLGKEEALAMCEANPHLDCFLIYEELDGTFATLQSSGFSRWVK